MLFKPLQASITWMCALGTRRKKKSNITQYSSGETTSICLQPSLPVCQTWSHITQVSTSFLLDLTIAVDRLLLILEKYTIYWHVADKQGELCCKLGLPAVEPQYDTVTTEDEPAGPVIYETSNHPSCSPSKSDAVSYMRCL